MSGNVVGHPTRRDDKGNSQSQKPNQGRGQADRRIQKSRRRSHMEVSSALSATVRKPSPLPSRQQTQPLELEVEQPVSRTATPQQPEWKQRKGWFQNTRTSRREAERLAATTTEPDGGESLMYYYQGGKMETDAAPKPPHAAPDQELQPESTAGEVSDSSQTQPTQDYVPPSPPTEQSQLPTGSVDMQYRMASWMTKSSADSLQDFDESEWTPADSSYGAAIPVMGWIPKGTRRTIEYSLIGVLIVALVYLVVATSIELTESNENSANGSDSGTLNLDDDLYVPYNDDNAITNDDYAAASVYSGDDLYDGNNRHLRYKRSVEHSHKQAPIKQFYVAASHSTS